MSGTASKWTVFDPSVRVARPKCAVYSIKWRLNNYISRCYCGHANWRETKRNGAEVREEMIKEREREREKKEGEGERERNKINHRDAVRRRQRRVAMNESKSFISPPPPPPLLLSPPLHSSSYPSWLHLLCYSKANSELMIITPARWKPHG